MVSDHRFGRFGNLRVCIHGMGVFCHKTVLYVIYEFWAKNDGIFGIELCFYHPSLGSIGVDNPPLQIYQVTWLASCNRPGHDLHILSPDLIG